MFLHFPYCCEARCHAWDVVCIFPLLNHCFQVNYYLYLYYGSNKIVKLKNKLNETTI